MALLRFTCLLTVILLFILEVTSENGKPLQCYTCGKFSRGCNDPFDNNIKADYVKPCTDKQNLCLKVRQPEEGDTWFRMCGTKEDCELYKKCYSCTGELCNASSYVIPSMTFVIIAFCVTFRF